MHLYILRVFHPTRTVGWAAVQTLRPLLVASPRAKTCAGRPLPLTGQITRSFAVEKKSTFSSSQLKVILKEYGPVAIVFHTVLSLGSLGGFYVLVNSGLDVPKMLAAVGFSIPGASAASTFGIAYVCHKVFMPVRCFITITCVPFIVRSLRARGWLKGPVPNTTK